jgi:hypothetical protein
VNAASVMHLSLPLALGDLVAQIKQRNLRTELRDKILLTVLPCPPTFLTGKEHEVVGAIAEFERACHEP